MINSRSLQITSNLWECINDVCRKEKTSVSKFRCLFFSFVLLSAWMTILAGTAESAMLGGVLQTWHKVTLTFDGPDVSELGDDNPFLNYRLSVTFRKGERQFVVPGYFAADGDAANSSASTGNRWRVHFRPQEVGRWDYSVSFRTGGSVALKLDTDLGNSEPWSPLDGTQGSFLVEVSDKADPDLRAADLGRVFYDGSHVLKYAGSGKPYFKIGEGSPENFLAYHEFDQTRDLKNNGFNEGLNSIYFLSFNIGADDKVASGHPKTVTREFAAMVATPGRGSVRRSD
jgi:hypothetical protein